MHPGDPFGPDACGESVKCPLPTGIARFGSIGNHDDTGILPARTFHEGIPQLRRHGTPADDEEGA